MTLAAEILHEATHPPRPQMGLTPEQLEMRRHFVGGSEIGTLLGLDVHRTILDVYAEKVHGIRQKAEPWMVWGHYQEEATLKYLANECGIVTRQIGTLVHPEFPWVGATPDGVEVGGEHRVVQVKNVGRWMLDTWGDAAASEAPMRYRAQVIWEIGVAKANGVSGSKGLLVPVFAGDAPNDWQYEIEFPERTFGVLVQVARKFMVECVEPEIEPKGWEESSSAADYVKTRWKTHDAEMREATQEAVQAVRQLRVAKVRRAKWERVEQMAQAKVCNLISDAQGIEGLCTWKANKKGVRMLRLLDEEG